MRVYHLLAEHRAMGGLERRRLKVARFDELNDPFELLGVELSGRGERRAFDRWKAQAAATFGLLCCSRTWRNPVLWSHYADRHRGMCLGFEVPDNLLEEARYLPERWKVPAAGRLAVKAVRQERRGFGLARARNAGARAAAHDILVFLDGDVIPEAGLVAAHARWHHAVSDAGASPNGS